MSQKRIGTDEGRARASGDARNRCLVALDGTGRIAFATPTAARRFGYDVADLVETPAERFVVDGDGTPFDRFRSLAADRGDGATVELAIRHHDGHTVAVDGTVERVEHDGRQFLTLVFHDGEPDRAGEGDGPAARPVADADRSGPLYTVGMFREVFDHLSDSLFVTDPDRGVIETCNTAACDLLGYEREDLLARSPSEVCWSDDAVVDEFVATVLERGAGWTDELACRTSDGTRRPVEASVAVVEFDNETRILWNLRDTTERHDRERTLRQQVAAMESAIDGMAIVDTDGTYVYVNQAHADIYGYDSPDDLLGESWQRLYDERSRERHERDIVPTLERRGYWRGESVGLRADGSTFEQDLSLATVNGGYVVGVVRDISDRKAAEQQLQALNRASRDLLSTESDREIAEYAVGVVERVVGFDISCIRLFDRESNGFDIVASTDGADRLMESRTAFKMRSTHAARAYRRNETVLKTDSTDAGGPDDGDEIRSSLHVPLGEYGVLSVLTTGEKTISERSVYLVDLLASDVTMVFEHTRRERLLRDHERELLLQRDRLQALDQINGVIREIIQRLPKATTPEEIGEIVCRCLADSALYRSAWLVGNDAGSALTALAGGDADARPSTRRTDPPRSSSDAVLEAVETGEIQVRVQYSITQHDPEVVEERTPVEAVLAVPVFRGRRVEEVLVVATDRADAFSEPERAEFELLGEMIGFVLSAVATKKLLIADSVLDLDFEVAAGDDVFVDLSERFDCVCTVEESVPLRGRRLLQYARVEGTSPDLAAEVAAKRDDVEVRRVLDEHEETGLFELIVSASPVTDLVDLGANVGAIVAEAGTGRIVVEAPSDVDIRTLVDVLRTHYEHVELVAKHERPRHADSDVRFDDVDEWLTDRQSTAIRAAYAAGYYDWPRKSTAEEVAGSLDITSATFHQHLRKAEEKLLRAYLAGHGGP